MLLVPSEQQKNQGIFAFALGCWVSQSACTRATWGCVPSQLAPLGQAGTSGNVGGTAVVVLDGERGPVGNQALPACLLGRPARFCVPLRSVLTGKPTTWG